MEQDQERTLARMMAMERTFETEGWTEIIKELEDEIEVIKGQLLAAPTWEEVKFLQGKAEQCFQLTNLSNYVYNMRDMMAQEEQEVEGVEDADVRL